MKKNILLSIFLAFAMFCGAQVPCWDGTVAESYNGGDGTMENPYQIATPQQLALLAQQTNDGTGGNACYILTEDICLNGEGDNINWTPMGYRINGTQYAAFTGVFDGNDHTVSNLYCIASKVYQCTGLFGCTENAIIKNVIVSDVYLTDGYSSGAVVGYAMNTNISNCNADGHVEANMMAGGIAGYCQVNANASSLIENCVNYSNVITFDYGGGITGYSHGDIVYKKCENYGVIEGEVDCDCGGIVGISKPISINIPLVNCVVEECVNHESAEIIATTAGGIVGRAQLGIINKCANYASITGHLTGDEGFGAAFVGGITGTGGVISNSYNRGDLTAIDYSTCNFKEAYIGGITGVDEPNAIASACNVYSTGNITPPDLSGVPETDYGFANIVGYTFHPDENYYNCFWLDGNEFPACGNEEMQEHPNLPGSCAFTQGSTPTSWVLNEPQYGTTDLLEALNAGSLGQCTWLEDVTGINDGYPIIDMDGEPDYQLVGDEWYYEIINSNGTISYQHLVHENDSTINDDKVKVIVKTNTLYDLRTNQTTHEYIYEENNKVYWWNKTLQEFTVLYDFGANVGDEWTITAGNNSVTVHVDEVGYLVKDARWFKAMIISDANDVFSGTVVCGIGHLTSFFPEQLLENKGEFDVDGIRCYWNDDILLYKEDDTDCDAVYNQWHSVDETIAGNGFVVYPNPAKDIFSISLSDNMECQSISIYSIYGRLLKSQNDNFETINIANLTPGLYLIKVRMSDGKEFSEKIVVK